MATATQPLRSPGRPRDPRRDEAIRDATLALLAEVGYDRMTLDAIAAAAGVSKPTIYRRWTGKQQLVADAIRLHPHQQAPTADTGTLRGDLLALVGQFAEQQRESAQIAAALASRLRESPELATLIREHAVETMRGRFALVVERAIERGELPADPPVSSLFADVAPAVIYTRTLMSLEPIDDALVTELVDRILLPVVFPSPPKAPTQ
jgi:AcrR family transcriptional regulator